MKKSIIGILLAGAIVFPALNGCKKSQEKMEEGPTPVSVAKPEVDSVMLRHTYPGYLTANNEVDLVARVNGTIVAHPYTAGDMVKKGDVLFRIDDIEYRNSVEQARANLDNAKASYDYYSKQYQAMKKALEADAVSQMEVLQAKSNMDEAEAQIRTYQASLSTAMQTLGYCTVRAPFNGRVSTWNYDIGSVVSGAASPVVLASIYDDSKVYANIEIDNASYLDLVNSAQDSHLDLKHMPVYFTEDLPHTYTADLTYMAPEMDKSTGTMLVKAEIKNPHGELRSGMYVTLGLPYANLDEALLIEDAAIGTDQLGKYVYVVNDSDQIVYTPIVAGELVGDKKRIVTKGLSRDSRYVTKALLKVRDGEKVRPITQ